jgi:hypothetical protein
MKIFLLVRSSDPNIYEEICGICRNVRGMVGIQNIPVHVNLPESAFDLSEYDYAISFAITSTDGINVSYKNVDLGKLITEEISNLGIAVISKEESELDVDCSLTLPLNLIHNTSKWLRQKKKIAEAVATAILLYLQKPLPDELIIPKLRIENTELKARLRDAEDALLTLMFGGVN